MEILPKDTLMVLHGLLRRTVVVIQCTTQSLCRPDSKDAEIYDNAAKIIEEAGFNVIREPIEGFC